MYTKEGQIIYSKREHNDDQIPEFLKEKLYQKKDTNNSSGDILELKESRNFLNNQLDIDEPLLTVSVDIDDNRHDDLNVYPNDNIEKVACDFCKKYSLGEDHKNYLIQHIKKNLNEYDEVNENLSKDSISSVKNRKFNHNFPPEIKEEKELEGKSSDSEPERAMFQIKPELKKGLYNARTFSSSFDRRYIPLINKNSEKIIRFQRDKATPIYQRLYNLSMVNKNKLTKLKPFNCIISVKDNKVNLDKDISKSYKNQLNKRSLNYFTNMYKNSLELMKEKSKKILKNEKNKIAKELKEATFFPKINMYYNKSNSTSCLRNKTLEHSSSICQDKISNKLEEWKKERDEESGKECTFHPIINPKSKRLNRSSSLKSENIFYLLYMDSFKKKWKTNELSLKNQKFDFKPLTTKLNPSILAPTVKILLTNNTEKQKYHNSRSMKQLQHCNSVSQNSKKSLETILNSQKQISRYSPKHQFSNIKIDKKSLLPTKAYNKKVYTKQIPEKSITFKEKELAFSNIVSKKPNFYTSTGEPKLIPNSSLNKNQIKENTNEKKIEMKVKSFPNYKKSKLYLNPTVKTKKMEKISMKAHQNLTNSEIVKLIIEINQNNNHNDKKQKQNSKKTLFSVNKPLNSQKDSYQALKLPKKGLN